MGSTGAMLSDVLTKEDFDKQVKEGRWEHPNFRYLEFGTSEEANVISNKLWEGNSSIFDYCIFEIQKK